jgi:hypothetical protein
VFGIGVLLFFWAVAATVRLIFIVQRYAISAAKSEEFNQKVDAAARKAKEEERKAREEERKPDAGPGGNKSG